MTANSRMSKGLLVLLVAIGVAVLLALGTWQLQRLSWKKGLQARVERNINIAPIDLDELLLRQRRGEGIDFVPVKVSGTFNHAAGQYYFTTDNGTPGWHVYTPLQRADGAIVFVNRGFVPYELKSSETRKRGLITGVRTVTGLARKVPEKEPNWFVPDNDMEKNVYYWKSLADMMANAGYPVERVVPLFVDADDTPNPGGLPQGGTTRLSFPNNHLQYALTWYGLALVLLVVGIMRVKSGNGADNATSRALQ